MTIAFTHNTNVHTYCNSCKKHVSILLSKFRTVAKKRRARPEISVSFLTASLTKTNKKKSNKPKIENKGKDVSTTIKIWFMFIFHLSFPFFLLICNAVIACVLFLEQEMRWMPKKTKLAYQQLF